MHTEIQELAEYETSRSANGLQQAVDAGQAVLFQGLLDPETGRIEFDWISDNLRELTGLNPAAFLSSDSWLERIHPDDRDLFLGGWHRLGVGRRQSCEYRIYSEEAGYRWVRDRRQGMSRSGDGRLRVVGSLIDITELSALRAKLHDQEQVLRRLLEADEDMVCVLGRDGRIREINPAGLALLEIDDPDDIAKAHIERFVVPGCRGKIAAAGRRVFQGEAVTTRLTLLSCRGRKRPVEVHAAPLYGPTGRINATVITSRDVTRPDSAESQAQYLAHFDMLTGLPNRALFRDRLLQAMAQAKRTDTLLAVMFLDMDNFKDVNDTLGHAVGDRLLREIAGRIKSCVRASDTVARFGGDEFGIIQTNLSMVEDAARLAERVVQVVGRPLTIEGHEIHPAVSIGVTLYPFEDHDAEDLLKSADMAMYKAKREGRNRYQFYVAELNRMVQRRAVIERELRLALERSQLSLHYQPQLSLKNGHVVGVEALLRWQHPERGPISPAEFIPVAESTGLIMPIGEWVLREACRQARAWKDAGLPPLRVAVNLSAAQFRHHNLLDTITRALEEAKLDPPFLEVELTESLIMKDVHSTIETLRHLHDLGVQISVDDFGTGYSSLSYLTRFPIHKIKLDQSFVRDVHNRDGAAIARTVIMLGRALKMRVMAEGVETVEQLEFLRQHHCHEVQGFYFSRPMPPGALERLLRDSREELRSRVLLPPDSDLA